MLVIAVSGIILASGIRWCGIEATKIVYNFCSYSLQLRYGETPGKFAVFSTA